jgi:hypothetical protein
MRAKLAVLVAMSLSGVVPTAGAQQKALESLKAYAETVDCAGHFMWLASAGEATPDSFEGFTLEQRVNGQIKLMDKARLWGKELGKDYFADVTKEATARSREVEAEFASNPQSVRMKLDACAETAGVR